MHHDERTRLRRTALLARDMDAPDTRLVLTATQAELAMALSPGVVLRLLDYVDQLEAQIGHLRIVYDDEATP